jgi:hypothetical protein
MRVRIAGYDDRNRRLIAGILPPKLERVAAASREHED